MQNQTFLILCMFLITMTIIFILYNSPNEYLTGTTTLTLSNESVQNMASILNTGQGTVQNLKIMDSLEIGNIKLKANTDGSVQFGATKLLQDGTIQFGESKLNPNGNITVGSHSLNADGTGTLTNPMIKWFTNGATWKLAPEGDVMVVRNEKATADSRIAFFSNVYADVSRDIVSPGNISGNTLSVPNYTLSKYAPANCNSAFGITDNAGARVYTFWSNHLRTVNPGTCSDKGRMDL